jgi:hypothetical protein
MKTGLVSGETSVHRWIADKPVFLREAIPNLPE